MKTEEKAKAYDRAKEKIVLRFGSNVAEEIFSEFDEPEDEKIISAIRKAIEAKVENLGNGVTRTACLAWLEKQGKCETDCHHNNQDANHPNGCIVLEDFNAGEGFYKVHLDYLSRKQVEVVEEMVRTWNNDSKASDEDIKSCIGMCLTDANEQRFKDYNTSLKGLAWLEMRGGQEEPQVYETKDGEIITYSETDGYKVVEPKFKVGDWIITPENKVIQITSIEGTFYCFNNASHYWEIYYCDQECHLWTIRDARDGDVLAFKGNIIGIIICKSPTDYDAGSYCRFVSDNFIDKEESGWDSTLLVPATKEQRGQLEKAMADAGYTFDFEKKELKKIEDEEYNDEDYGIDGLWHAKNILEKTLGEVEGYQTDDGILDHKCAISAVDKLYKEDDKNRWKPSDEYIHWLKWVINRMPDTEKTNEAEAVLKDLLEQLEEL